MPVHAQGFVDVTDAAGVSYIQQTPGLFPNRCRITGNNRFSCEPQRMTGGAAVGDFDGDGLDDLFATRYREPSLLFRNEGDGTFSDVTLAAGIPLIDYANGAAWLDIEHDGDLDLFVGTTGGLQYYLFVNDGGVFSEQAQARGVAANNGKPHMSYGIAVGDFDSDGWNDIYTCEWRAHTLVTPSELHHSRLFKNRGGSIPGYFKDVTSQAGADIRLFNPNGVLFSFGPAITDLDQDGHPDLAIAGDFGTNLLLWNDGDGTFTNGTVAAGVDSVENGMGSTFADYDLDGDLDWFVTSIFDPLDSCANEACNWGATGNRLYRNDGGRLFSDATDDAGVRNGWWGWGAAFMDYDNDIDPDLIMTNGFDVPGGTSQLTQYLQDPMLFWVNDGTGGYTEQSVALGLTDTRQGKGLLVFDFDADGDQDTFIANNSAAPVLYENKQDNGNGWLRIRFRADGKPYELLNAKVWLTAEEGGVVQYRETGVSTHFIGQSESTLHFGLGPNPPELLHRLAIECPKSGELIVLEDVVAPNQTYDVEVPNSERAVKSPFSPHDADYIDANGKISLSELLRVIQLNRFGYYRKSVTGEDGFARDAGPSSATSGYHNADYNPSDWQISITELLRVIQLYNAVAYVDAVDEEDGFLPFFESMN